MAGINTMARTICEIEPIERVRVAEALRESEARFRAAFEDGAVPMSLTTQDGTLHNVNAAFCQMLGYTKAELTGRNSADFTHPDDVGTNRDGMERVISGSATSFRMEKRYIRKDGGRIWGDLSAAFAHDAHGKPLYMVTQVQDITARKQAEDALRRANAELEVRVAERTAEVQARARQLQVLAGEMTQAEERERRRLAVILHDHLQQLLVAAKLRARLVADQAQTPAVQREMIQVVELLSQSIEVSRSLTAELSPPVLYDGGLVLALQWLGRWMQEKHRLRVTVEGDPAVEPTRAELKVFLFQAARELLLNAVKHAGAAEAKLELAAEHNQFRLCVQDHGRGFDPASVHPWPRDRASGGFGLFSVRERLELLGGSMHIDSAPGRGTRVTLLTPLEQGRAVRAATASRPRRSAPAARVRKRGGRVRVLVADDHKVIREGLACMLKMWKDIELVGQAADGQEALDLAHALHPDVVVMDISMPNLNGIEATKRISAELPGVKVIGLSMHQKEDVASTACEVGAVAYLSKDGPLEELVGAIRACRDMPGKGMAE